MPVVRIRNRGMFPSGSAIVTPRFVPLLKRIGSALRRSAAPVEVIGYTDNQPIRTVQFPSNFQLSAARAKAARPIIARAHRRPVAHHDGGPRRTPTRSAITRRRRGARRTGGSR